MAMTKIKPDYFTFRTDDYRFCRAGKFDGNWERRIKTMYNCQNLNSNKNQDCIIKAIINFEGNNS